MPPKGSSRSTPGTVLSQDVMSQLAPIVTALPNHTDLLLELKTSLLEAIRMPKKEAVNHLRIRLEPAVLVNDDVAPKRNVYRAILMVLASLGIPSEEVPGISIVELTIDTLYDTEQFTEVNIRAKELYKLHVDGRARGAPSYEQIRHSPRSQTTQNVRSTTAFQNESSSRSTPQDSVARKLSSAAYTFRDSSHRFSGDYD